MLIYACLHVYAGPVLSHNAVFRLLQWVPLFELLLEFQNGGQLRIRKLVCFIYLGLKGKPSGWIDVYYLKSLIIDFTGYMPAIVQWNLLTSDYLKVRYRFEFRESRAKI